MLELDKIYNMDCIEGMKQIPDNYVDLVLTDPPYGITQNRWDRIPDWNILTSEMKRILKENGQIIIFGRQPNLMELHYQMKKIFEFRHEIIWDKMQNMWTSNYAPLAIHENIFIYCNKKVKKNSLTFNLKSLEFSDGTTIRRRIIRNDVLSSNQGKGWNKSYLSERVKKYPISILQHRSIKIGKEYVGFPTQKPVKIIDWLIKGYSNVNNIILDSFMGSGTTAVSCKRLNRRFIGFEIDKNYYDVSLKRLLNVPVRLDSFGI